MGNIQQMVDESAWRDSLKPGDKFGVYDLHGHRFVHEAEVARRTPSGRIVSTAGYTYKPDGYYNVPRGTAYADRKIGPLPDKPKAPTP